MFVFIIQLHCGSKKRIPVTSSNSCTEYDPISVIFGSENRQRVFSLQVSNWRVLIKLGTSFVFLHGNNHLQQTTLNGSVQRGPYFNIKKNLYECAEVR